MGHNYGLHLLLSPKRKINRTWPMVLFIHVFDTAAIASFVIWMYNNPDWKKSSKAIRCRQFIVSLRESLAEPLTIEDFWTMHPSSEDQSWMQSNFYSWALDKPKQ